MTVLEEAKAHLATFGASHTECCGMPILRKVVAELERLETEAFAMSAGICEYRGGDKHGNPLCLKTGRSI